MRVLLSIYIGILRLMSLLMCLHLACWPVRELSSFETLITHTLADEAVTAPLLIMLYLRARAPTAIVVHIRRIIRIQVRHTVIAAIHALGHI